MKLPTLYSRRSDGNVQEWTVEVEKDKYRTIHGVKDGTLVTSEWTVATPKNVGRSNSTTGEAQALKEAHADWDKKVASGYVESVSDIDTQLFFEPMLAKDCRLEGISYPVYCQPKLDGIRCIATRTGLWSRNGKKFTSCPHIEEALKDTFVKNPNLILDGEFYADKYSDNFNEICKLIRKQKCKEADYEKSRKGIEYWIYDMPSAKQDTFGIRKLNYESLISKLESPYIKTVRTIKADSREVLDEWYGKWIEAGYEGQMIRTDSLYENKRSKYLLKRKEFKDGEYVVKDVEEGVGNRSGTAGCFILHHPNGSTFRSNIKGDKQFVTQLLKNKASIIGKQVTVKYFNLTPDGVPRFPYVTAIRDYE